MTKTISLSLLLLVLGTAPALAQGPDSERSSVIVRTADLDLSSPDGQRRFDRRVDKAVVEACGTASSFDLAGSNDVRRCRDEARSKVAELASRSAPIILASARE